MKGVSVWLLYLSIAILFALSFNEMKYGNLTDEILLGGVLASMFIAGLASLVEGDIIRR